MPANRGKIVTAARDENRSCGDVLAFLRKELEAGRQAYVIYPLIDESDKLDAKAAAAEFERWRERLRPFRCELLHGRIPAPEKQAIMERFRRGETQRADQHDGDRSGRRCAERDGDADRKCGALRAGAAASTARPDRARRAQVVLHFVERRQIAGRRSAKLAVLEKTSDGFEVAEADWDQRGPGDLLGTAQSGLPALQLGNLKTDMQLMLRARAAANAIFEWDPHLEAPENQRFRKLVVEEQGRSFSNVS